MSSHTDYILGFLPPKQVAYARLHKLNDLELTVLVTLNTLAGRFKDAQPCDWEMIAVEVAPLLCKRFAPPPRGPMPAETPDDLMSVSAAADRLRVHTRTVYKALLRGDVRRYGWRNATRVSLREILKLEDNG
jgi:hypothetical protein